MAQTRTHSNANETDPSCSPTVSVPFPLVTWYTCTCIPQSLCSFKLPSLQHYCLCHQPQKRTAGSLWCSHKPPFSQMLSAERPPVLSQNTTTALKVSLPKHQQRSYSQPAEAAYSSKPTVFLPSHTAAERLLVNSPLVRQVTVEECCCASAD